MTQLPPEFSGSGLVSGIGSDLLSGNMPRSARPDSLCRQISGQGVACRADDCLRQVGQLAGGKPVHLPVKRPVTSCLRN